MTQSLENDTAALQSLKKRQEELDAVRVKLSVLKEALETGSEKDKLQKRTEISRLENGALQKALVNFAFAKSRMAKG
jgi:hypothetical protein